LRLDQAYPREQAFSIWETELLWHVEDLAKYPNELIYLIPIMIFFNKSIDEAGPIRVVLMGLILQQVGNNFRRKGMFMLKSDKDAEILAGLDDKDGASWLRGIVHTLHERGSLSSYFLRVLFL
jgi:hypothetical protein